MAAASIEVETRGAVALVTLNRPESSNTLKLEMAMDLLAAAMTCARNAAVRAVVLTGAGRHFCFGGDLRGMAARAGAGDDYVRELTTYLHAAISHFVRMDAPVIAAVNGTAAGAGVGLVAMADLALCGSSSKFNLAYTNVGLPPDAGTSARPQSRGFGPTKRLLAHSLGAFESQMVLESETIAAHAVSAEGAEGIAAFLDKRKPRFPEAGLG